MNEHQEVITILHARIKEIRQLEQFCLMLGVKIDEKRIRNKIGGIMKVIAYIEKLTEKAKVV